MLFKEQQKESSDKKKSDSKVRKMEDCGNKVQLIIQLKQLKTSAVRFCQHSANVTPVRLLSRPYQKNRPYQKTGDREAKLL